jgi:hypothetical protein
MLVPSSSGRLTSTNLACAATLQLDKGVFLLLFLFCCSLRIEQNNLGFLGGMLHGTQFVALNFFCAKHTNPSEL